MNLMIIRWDHHGREGPRRFWELFRRRRDYSSHVHKRPAHSTICAIGFFATEALFMPENFRQRVKREFFKKFVQPVEDEYLTKFPEMDQASYVRKATNAVFKRARVEKG
jgi:hypothetical protein